MASSKLWTATTTNTSFSLALSPSLSTPMLRDYSNADSSASSTPLLGPSFDTVEKGIHSSDHSDVGEPSQHRRRASTVLAAGRRRTRGFSRRLFWTVALVTILLGLIGLASWATKHSDDSYGKHLLHVMPTKVKQAIHELGSYTVWEDATSTETTRLGSVNGGSDTDIGSNTTIDQGFNKMLVCTSISCREIGAHATPRRRYSTFLIHKKP